MQENKLSFFCWDVVLKLLLGIQNRSGKRGQQRHSEGTLILSLEFSGRVPRKTHKNLSHRGWRRQRWSYTSRHCKATLFSTLHRDAVFRATITSPSSLLNAGTTRTSGKITMFRLPLFFRDNRINFWLMFAAYVTG